MKISVIMPTKNAEKYINEAIDSILNQTFSDFEFLIIDDNSTDDTLRIIHSYNDKRIKLVNGPQKGLSAALNFGIKLAQGEYIARMDADDISLPHRFEKQVRYLDTHPEVSLLGTWQEHFGDKTGIHKPNCEPDIAKMALIFSCDFCHSTAMFRKNIFIENDLFYPENSPIEDFELWSKAIASINVANIPEILGKYRVHNKSITAQKNYIMGEYETKIILNNLRNYFNIDCNIQNCFLKSRRLHSFSHLKKHEKIEFQQNLHILFQKIELENKLSHFIDIQNISKAMEYCWFQFCGYANYINSSYAPQIVKKNLYILQFLFQPINQKIYLSLFFGLKIQIKNKLLYNIIKSKIFDINS